MVSAPVIEIGTPEYSLQHSEEDEEKGVRIRVKRILVKETVKPRSE
jgi:hypothetical protein